MILVVTGTHEQPFARLVLAADRYAMDHPGERVLVQHGRAAPPRHAEGAAWLKRDTLSRLQAEADVIVTHGGPGSILEALDRGRLPIACPRRVSHGEHVDDHQLAFVAHMAQRGSVIPLYDVSEFDTAVATARTSTFDTAARNERVAANRIRLAAELDALHCETRP